LVACGGQMIRSEQVYTLAVSIIEKYFVSEEDDLPVLVAAAAEMTNASSPDPIADNDSSF
jgi:hypothetical protein